jgi:hypothetical protein
MKNHELKTNTLYFDGKAIAEIVVTGDSARDAETARQVLKDKGLYTPPTLGNAMFRQAVSFATTSSYLYAKDLTEIPRNQFSVVPFIVNAAFGIELYLKTLANIHGKTLTGHQLLKLYDSLPTKAKESIEVVVPEFAKQRAIKLPIDFRKCISELNDTFVVWRYIHETSNASEVNIQNMIFVMQCLHQICNDAQGS